MPQFWIYLYAAACLVLVAASFRLLCVWRKGTQLRGIAKAQNWMAADGVVDSSFELDETILRPRTWLKLLWAWLGLLVNSEGINPERVPVDSEGRDCSLPWIVGLRYSYRVTGNMYVGSYFLPVAFADSGEASEAGKAWIGKHIRIRYNPDKPDQSAFLQVDGAPGKSRIPAGLSSEPYIASLSLK